MITQRLLALAKRTQSDTMMITAQDYEYVK